MKKIVFSSFLLLTSIAGFSQSILNASSAEEFRKLREENKEKKGDSIVSIKAKPLEYGYIEEKDVLRSMLVWEVIDLNDRINQPFYHNSDGLVTQNKSLYQLLFDGVINGDIKEVYEDDMFTTKINPDQVQEKLRSIVLSDWLVDKMNSGEKISEDDKRAGTDVYETKSENVKLLKVKGMWYIDRRDSQMKYRLLGIAAMGKDPSTMGLQQQLAQAGQELMEEEDTLVDLFWIFYPDAREILANAVVFNNRNLSSQITYDDLLNARRFGSIIYKSDNGLGNGVIKDYIPGDSAAQLEESERIKSMILEMENDMWNY